MPKIHSYPMFIGFVGYILCELILGACGIYFYNKYDATHFEESPSPECDNIKYMVKTLCIVDLSTAILVSLTSFTFCDNNTRCYYKLSPAIMFILFIGIFTIPQIFCTCSVVTGTGCTFDTTCMNFGSEFNVNTCHDYWMTYNPIVINYIKTHFYIYAFVFFVIVITIINILLAFCGISCKVPCAVNNDHTDSQNGYNAI